MNGEWTYRRLLKHVITAVPGLMLLGLVYSCGERVSPVRSGWSHPTEVRTLSGHTGEVTRAMYSPSGSRIITLSQDSTARIWDAETGAGVAVLVGHSNAVMCAVFHPGGELVTTFALDRKLIRWDVQTGRVMNSTSLAGNEARIASADFSPDGTLLALGLNGRSEVYDVESGALIYELSPFGHPGLRVNTMDIGFRPDGGRILTAAYSQEIAVWDAIDGARILNLHEHGQGAITAAYHPEMTHIASGSRDSTIIIWHARLGTILTKLRPGWEVLAVAFSPDGSTLLAVERAPRGEVRRASLWDLASYRRVAKLSGFGPVRNESFNPDGSRFVTPTGHTARIFAAGNEIQYERPQAIQYSVEPAVLADTALTSSDGRRRIEAAHALRQLGWAADVVVPRLTDSLVSRSPDTRLRAALTLADIGVPSWGGISALIDRLGKDPNASVRTAAALAIGGISGAKGEAVAIPQLIARLKDEDAGTRYHAAHALDQMMGDAEDILPALAEAVLTDQTFGIRRMIAFNLGNAGTIALSAIPTLIEATTSENERSRWWASYSIWSIAAANREATRDAIPALKLAMGDPSDFRDKNGGPPRKYAIHAVGAVGPVVLEVDPHVIPVLGDIMINDDDYYHRKAAALALENILQVKGLRQKVRGYVRRTPPPPAKVSQ
ncbi:MAG: HEAT repeat domain-containing protein [Fidelibacterota bacterium]|nr:MAG: HEAT repeat domain-containing protein [Candidatus Neomarinimicrobiota bacterium]